MPIPTLIYVRAHGGRALGLLTTDGLLVLQRRGTSSRLEACLPGICVEVRRAAGPDRRWTVAARVCDDRPVESRRPSLAAACARAAEHVADALGEPVAAAPFVGAYTYERRPPEPLEGIAERVVSPLYFDPAADAVRIAGSGALAAHFPGGGFDAVSAADGPAARHARPHVIRALRLGFHTCDRRLGDDHCKRRLAWLAGAYLLEDSPGPVPCGVLRLDMAREPVPPPGS